MVLGKLTKGWRLRSGPVPCRSVEECLRACEEGKAVEVDPEVLLKIAEKASRPCIALVRAERVGTA